MPLLIPKKPLTRQQQDWAQARLSNWQVLNRALASLDMVEIRTLITHEVRSCRRMALLERLVARYSKLEARGNGDELVRLVALEQAGEALR